MPECRIRMKSAPFAYVTACTCRPTGLVILVPAWSAGPATAAIARAGTLPSLRLHARSNGEKMRR